MDEVGVGGGDEQRWRWDRMKQSKSIPNRPFIVTAHNNLCVYCVVDAHWLLMPVDNDIVGMNGAHRPPLCVYSGEQHTENTADCGVCARSKLVWTFKALF